MSLAETLGAQYSEAIAYKGEMACSNILFRRGLKLS
jgi:hypothetical protein